MQTFNDFAYYCCEQIPLPEDDIRRVLTLHLEAAGISEQDIEIYINYPEFTEQELAARFAVSVSTISHRLARVRKAWPALLNDPKAYQHGHPAFRNMKRIGFGPDADDWLGNIRMKF